MARVAQLGIFDSVQATFNVLDQSAGPALGRAKDSGMDVIVKVHNARHRAGFLYCTSSAAMLSQPTPFAALIY